MLTKSAIPELLLELLKERRPQEFPVTKVDICSPRGGEADLHAEATAVACVVIDERDGSVKAYFQGKTSAVGLLRAMEALQKIQDELAESYLKLTTEG